MLSYLILRLCGVLSTFFSKWGNWNSEKLNHLEFTVLLNGDAMSDFETLIFMILLWSSRRKVAIFWRPLHSLPSSPSATETTFLCPSFLTTSPYAYVNSWLWHVESSSLTRDWTRAPLHWDHRILTTGPLGKSWFLLIFHVSLITLPCSHYPW